MYIKGYKVVCTLRPFMFMKANISTSYSTCILHPRAQLTTTTCIAH